MIECYCLNRHDDESEEEYGARLAHLNLTRPREVRTVEHPQHTVICGTACQWFACSIHRHGLQRIIDGDD